MYLNTVYFGHGAYGIKSAARLYFDSEVDQLALEENALLAGLLPGPNRYSPLHHPERARKATQSGAVQHGRQRRDYSRRARFPVQ